MSVAASVTNLIERASDEEWLELNLSGRGLVHIPLQIFELKNIEILKLTGNLIEEIPAEISKLQNIKQLSLDRNRINRVPSSIYELIHLKLLDLEENKIDVISDEIRRLLHLKTLILVGNRIDKLPMTIGELRSLERLQLDRNELKDIPLSIEELVNLERLDINENKIKAIPRGIAGLKKLETFEIKSNQIEFLPSEIGQLTGLENLRLSSNHLLELPDEIGLLSKLRELDINDNLISVLPKSLGGLKTLHYLRINHGKGRPLTNPLPPSYREFTKYEPREATARLLEWLRNEYPITPEYFKSENETKGIGFESSDYVEIDYRNGRFELVTKFDKDGSLSIEEHNAIWEQLNILIDFLAERKSEIENIDQVLCKIFLQYLKIVSQHVDRNSSSEKQIEFWAVGQAFMSQIEAFLQRQEFIKSSPDIANLPMISPAVAGLLDAVNKTHKKYLLGLPNIQKLHVPDSIVASVPKSKLRAYLSNILKHIEEHSNLFGIKIRATAKTIRRGLLNVEYISDHVLGIAYQICYSLLIKIIKTLNIINTHGATIFGGYLLMNLLKNSGLPNDVVLNILDFINIISSELIGIVASNSELVTIIQKISKERNGIN